MAEQDLSKLTDEQLGVYRDLLAKKQDPNAAILAQQAVKFPTAADQGGKAGSITAPPPDLLSRIESYLPSPRTAAQVGGATAGGALGTVGGPFGVAAGGALGAGVGESLYQNVQRFRGAPSPQTSNDAAGEIGSAMTGGLMQEGAGELLPAAGKKLASTLYRTSLKPSTSLSVKEASDLSANLLKERIPVSPGGMRKLNSTISDLGGQVANEIGSVPGVEVSPSAVASRIDPTIQKFGYKDLQRDMSAAAGEKARFLNEHSTPVQYSPFNPNSSAVPQVQTRMQENPIPATRAQAMKQAIWQELAPADFGTVAPGYREARHDIGTGLRQELETAVNPATGDPAFPNIRDLNAREGKLLTAKPELNRAVNRTENRDMIGIGGPIVGAATEAVTGNPILAAIAALGKNSGSRTAILLDQLSRKMGPIVPAALPRFGVIPLKNKLAELSQ